MTELGIEGGTRAEEGEGRCPTQRGREGNGACDLNSAATAVGPKGLWLYYVLGKAEEKPKDVRLAVGIQCTIGEGRNAQ